MRAIVQQSFGGPEVLELVETDRPEPLPTEVLVRVRAAGVNPVEPIVRAGIFPLLGPPPFILGWDVSGVVEEVVPGVSRFRPGDEVYGMPFFPRAASAYAEFVAAPSRQLAHKPRSIDHVHAAALPLAGLTAWQALVDVAQVKAGDRVLVHGAAGGVGHLAVQIAKALGAYVVGSASTAKLPFVTGLGVDEAVDYTSVDPAVVATDMDVVIEPLGPEHAVASLRSLRPGGLLLSLVSRGDEVLQAQVEAAGRRFAGISVEPDHVGLQRMAELVDAGLLTPHVEHTVPLEEAAKAHEILETTSALGKTVLVV